MQCEGIDVMHALYDWGTHEGFEVVRDVREGRGWLYLRRRHQASAGLDVAMKMDSRLLDAIMAANGFEQIGKAAYYGAIPLPSGSTEWVVFSTTDWRRK